MRLLQPFLLLLLFSTTTHAQVARLPHALPRCSPTLLADSLRQVRSSQPQVYTLQVSDLEAFQYWASTQPLRLLSAYAPAQVVSIESTPAVFWGEVMTQPNVLFADRGARYGKEELAVPGHNLFVNRIQAARARWPQYDGSGITASVKEYRFDSADVDFLGRYLPSLDAPLPPQLHTHIMATLIGGGGNSDPAGRGAAPGVRLTSSSFAGLLPDPDAHYSSQQIRVQNHSYGNDIENHYGPAAAAYDHSVQQHPELLHVFSAGNEGTTAISIGPYASIPGFANLTGNFKMAKNALVVGAVDSFGQWLPFSSSGPAYDGRLKPDLVAFGAAGTSESAALTSGAAAVLQQVLSATVSPLPACAVRAFLLHSADDLPPLGPDFHSGYGNLNLKNALRMATEGKWGLAQIRAGDTLRFILNDMPAGSSRLRITLAWDDPPAVPGSAVALLHDLDLEVLAPDGRRWLPWLLNMAPHADSLSQAARRGRDSLNTVEQVLIPDLVSGIYEVPIIARGSWAGTQTLVMVYTWEPANRFDWDCPVHNDPAISGQEAILRWSAHLPIDSGRVEWRATGGAEWQPIHAAVDLGAGYCRWLVPDTFAAAQVRMVAGTEVYLSDTFLIAPPLRMQVVLNCADSVRLRWNQLHSPAARYRVWGLGSRYLEPLFITPDTVVVLQKADYPHARFAVSAWQVADAAEGPLSPAPDITQQGVGCYANTLLALLNAQGEIDLSLDLGEVQEVQEVFLEKKADTGWQLLHEAVSPVSPVQYTDRSPATGANTYRGRVVLHNGHVALGEPVTVLASGDASFALLPTVVTSGQSVWLLANPPEQTSLFRLYDAMGRELLALRMVNSPAEAVLPEMKPGVYFWWQVSETDGRRRAGGKLLVRH